MSSESGVRAAVFLAVPTDEPASHRDVVSDSGEEAMRRLRDPFQVLIQAVPRPE